MRKMKGKLEKIDDKWYLSSGDFKLPLHPSFVTMTDYVYIRGDRFYNGYDIEFTEVFVNSMGREVDPNNLGQNHSSCVWYAKPYLGKKEEQKQHIVDIMESDEELGLYDESREIKFEDVFNDEKKEDTKRIIHQHKVLKGLSLVNPVHLEMTSNGHGEFPDGYKLTEKGIQYIIEQLNKEEQKQLENDWEEILFDFIDFYPCILPNELFEWLDKNYEIPKKKNG